MIESESDSQDASAHRNCEISEEEIDLNLEDTFPASDPPSWTLGTNHCQKSPAESDEEESGTDEPASKG
jgi:hypothetical protein